MSWVETIPGTRSRLVRVDDHRIHALQTGDPNRPAVVFLHGNPTWSYLYRHQLPVISDLDLRALAPDLLGFGRSEKPEEPEDHSLERHIRVVRGLLNERNVDRWVLVAHDWGGPIGLGAARRHEHDPLGIVLMNTGSFHGVHLPLAFRFLTLPGIGELLLDRLNGFVEVLMRVGTFQRQRLRPEVMRYYREPFRSSSRAGVVAFPRMIPTGKEHENWSICHEIDRYLSRLDVPVLVLSGAHDPVLGPAYGRKMVSRCRKGRHGVLSRAGHYLQEDRPGRLRSILRRFLRRMM